MERHYADARDRHNRRRNNDNAEEEALVQILIYEDEDDDEGLNFSFVNVGYNRGEVPIEELLINKALDSGKEVIYWDINDLDNEEDSIPPLIQRHVDDSSVELDDETDEKSIAWTNTNSDEEIVDSYPSLP